MTEPDQNVDSSARLLPLWLGVLLPPIIWSLQMEINYALVRRACVVEHNLTLYMVTIVALALTVGSGAIAGLNWRRTRSHWLNDRAELLTRNRFMAILGLLSSAMFFLVILAQGLATILFHPCQL